MLIGLKYGVANSRESVKGFQGFTKTGRHTSKIRLSDERKSNIAGAIPARSFLRIDEMSNHHKNLLTFAISIILFVLFVAGNAIWRQF
jgi:hypothetical protein